MKNANYSIFFRLSEIVNINTNVNLSIQYEKYNFKNLNLQKKLYMDVVSI